MDMAGFAEKDIRLVVADIGEVLTESGNGSMPSAAVVEAVQKILDAGVHLAIATGRPWPVARPVVEALGLTGPIICNGGSEIWQADGEKSTRLVERFLSVAQLHALGAVASNHGLAAQIEDETHTQRSPAGEATEPVGKAFILDIPPHTVQGVLAELESAVPDTAAFPTKSKAVPGYTDIHVTHTDGTKAQGVHYVADYYGLHIDQLLAIGNSHNDIGMLQAVGTAVAMGDSPAEVLAVADYTVGTVRQDGVAEALNRFVLPQNQQ